MLNVCVVELQNRAEHVPGTGTHPTREIGVAKGRALLPEHRPCSAEALVETTFFPQRSPHRAPLKPRKARASFGKAEVPPAPSAEHCTVAQRRQGWGRVTCMKDERSWSLP